MPKKKPPERRAYDTDLSDGQWELIEPMASARAIVSVPSVQLFRKSRMPLAAVNHPFLNSLCRRSHAASTATHANVCKRQAGHRKSRHPAVAQLAVGKAEPLSATCRLRHCCRRRDCVCRATRTTVASANADSVTKVG
jgi:hypothetical protein